MKKINKTFMILAIVGVLGFGINALAHMDKGCGPSGWGNHGSGRHHRGWSGPGYGHMMGDLNDDDFNKMDEERQVFFKETEDLRQELSEKHLALKSELIKKNPDVEKAASLQKEVSGIEAKLDQKRVEHMIKMKGMFPNVGRGFMGKGFMGSGPMGGVPGNGGCRR